MIIKSGKLAVDLQDTKDGSVRASVNVKTNRKMKFRLAKDGTVMTFDLKNDGTEEIFPLQLGNGYYEASLYENVSGKKYSVKGAVRFGVKLSRPDAAQLVPNQYMNYTEDSEVVKTANSLCEGKTEAEAYKAIYAYVKRTFAYDFIKAINLKSGMLPDIEGTFKKKMGVCQDLAAVTVAMLRSQGIPAKLVIGYADKQYHAWVTATVMGKEMFFDPTLAISAISPVKKYTAERWY